MAIKTKITRKRGGKGSRPNAVMRKYVHARLSRLWRDATKIFVTVLVDSMVDDQAGVDTGMSKASVLPLAAKVRFKSALAATITGKGPRAHGQDINTFSYSPPGITRSKAAGERRGKRAFKLSFGTPESPVFRLEFEIVVLQHLIHEEHWRSLEKALAAMTNFVERNKFKEPYLVPGPLATWLVTGVLTA